MSTSQMLRPKQGVDQSQITKQQSLQEVKVLVDAAIGCISFLRGIFADDAFVDQAISKSAEPSSNGKGVRIKKLARGGSKEADTLLDYVDGVQDALERSYLKTLMFAIYVDPEKPSDLIECYTLNFTYYEKTVATSAGGSTTISRPSMQIRDEMRNVQVSADYEESQVHKKRRRKRSPTDVREQIAKLIKGLISMTQTLASLPRRRFISIKLYYTDDTPAEYQPPHFQDVDFDESRYKFGTHDREELPDRVPLGRVDTGYHSVSLNLATVAQYLPQEDDDTVAAPREDLSEQAGMTEAEKELAANRAEAAERPIVWDVEDMGAQDSEVECERDTQQGKSGSTRKPKPQSQRFPDGTVQPLNFDIPGRTPLKPVIEDWAPSSPQSPSVQPFSDFDVAMSAVVTDDAVEMSVEPTPAPVVRFSSLVTNQQLHALANPEPFDALPLTQTNPLITATPGDPAILVPPTPSSHEEPMGVPLFETQYPEDSQISTIATSDLKKTMQAFAANMGDDIGSPSQLEQEKESIETPFAETQPDIATKGDNRQDMDLDEDPIESITEESLLAAAQCLEADEGVAHNPMADDSGINHDFALPPPLPRSSNLVASAVARAQDALSGLSVKDDNPISAKNGDDHIENEQGENTDPCDCGQSTGDGEMVCCDHCSVWLHTTCYGYDTGKKVEDETFACWKCRHALTGPVLPEQQGRLDNALEALKFLALYRRVIVLCESTAEMPSAAQLKELLACDLPMATQLFDRLESDGFVQQEARRTESQRSGKATVRTIRSKKRYLFVRTAEQKHFSRTRYFVPDGGAEKDILDEMRNGLPAPSNLQRASARLTDSVAFGEAEEPAPFISSEALKKIEKLGASRDRRAAREENGGEPMLQPITTNSPHSSPRPSIRARRSMTPRQQAPIRQSSRKRGRGNSASPYHKRAKTSRAVGIETVEPLD